MDFASIIALAGVIVGFAGVAVSGFALWMTYLERRSSYRQFLYSKQFDGYSALLRATDRLMYGAGDFISDHESGTKEDVWKEFFSPNNELYIGISITFNDWYLFMPSQMNEHVLHVMNTFLEIGDLSHQEDPIKLLMEACNNVIDYARDAIGTDHLSGETNKIILKSQPKSTSRGAMALVSAVGKTLNRDDTN